MDQIICDICGSAYPQTADLCPVCGYPRQGDEKAAAPAEEIVRTKVKGGRFSRKHVRKLHQNRSQEGQSSNRGLWITIIVLLVAIVLVSAYIVLRFWDGWGDFTGGTQPATRPTATETTPAPTTLPCSALSLDVRVVELERQGEQCMLSVKPVPEQTTDRIVYASADPSVAQVSQTGVITAVGYGRTTVTVTCGSVTEECAVICWFSPETTAPSETTPPPETTGATAPAVLTLDQSDVSLFQPGEGFTIRVMLGDRSIGRSSVTWTSSNPEVATVEKGVVTAVGPGNAEITAQYQGQKAVCVVRCRFRDTAWRASSTDVTLAVGKSFRLSVINNSGETADVVWTMDREGVVSVENGTVTALTPGTVTLAATVDGVKVWCIVRVKG